MKLTQWDKDVIDLALGKLADSWGRDMSNSSKPGYHQLNHLREKLGHSGTATGCWKAEVVVHLKPPVKGTA